MPDVRRTLRRAFAVLAAVAVALAAWAFLIEPGRLVVRRVDLALPRWPAAHAGLRVALLSDLHVGSPHWDLSHLRELVATTNAERPDLVLLAGDYVIDGVRFGSPVAPEPIGEALGELRAPLGVVAVLGNHDWWNDGDRITRAFRDHGLIVLDNEAYRVEHAGAPLWIVGLADKLTRPQRVRETIALVPAGEATIAVTHEPDVFPFVDDRPSLTVAGHTHGGQVCLPLVGCPVVPSAYGQRFVAGHVIEEGRHLFVTTGVGTSIWPVRFGVPPEVDILTLR